jgi:cytosine/adenosine deaminase-related metal-dependent hydrolase
MGERLARRRRGVFAPAELFEALGPAGHRCLGQTGGSLRVGEPADLVELTGSSVRTAGADAVALPLVASAADVRRVVVGGRTLVVDGRLSRAADGSDDPAVLLVRALGG